MKGSLSQWNVYSVVPGAAMESQCITLHFFHFNYDYKEGNLLENESSESVSFFSPL